MIIISIVFSIALFSVFLGSPRSKMNWIEMSLGTWRVIGLWIGIPLLIAGGGAGFSPGAESLYNLPLLLASGAIFPFHSWVVALFERMRPTAAALIISLGAGSIVWFRIFAHFSSTELNSGIEFLALFTAVYAALLAGIQKKARRLVGWLCVSLSAQIVCASWGSASLGSSAAQVLSIALFLCAPALALCLEAIEIRTRDSSYSSHRGLGIRAPLLSTLFLIFGLVIAGLPGLMSFVGEDLLFASAYSNIGIPSFFLILAGALNAIAVFRAHGLIFLGVIPKIQIQDLQLRERVALGILLVSLLGYGICPKHLISKLIPKTPVSNTKTEKESS